MIKNREDLLVTKKEIMTSRFNIDVRDNSEVVAIDRENQRITVHTTDGKKYQESYDNLVIATGSSPIRPKIDGIDSDKIKTLWTVPDTDEIKAFISENSAKRAAVVGGGFIGLEMAENLRHIGLEVTIVEAATGANEKTLNKKGLEKDKDYTSVIISQNSHAGYYPDAQPMIIKLIFSIDGEKIYGAQIVGKDGVDKRIDTLGTAIRFGASVSDLSDMELAYAPPYSSAKDPVNMLGFVAENVLSGMVKFCDWNETDTDKDAIILDVRVYNTYRILKQNGFENVKVYPAGSRLYMSTHINEDEVSDEFICKH